MVIEKFGFGPERKLNGLGIGIIVISDIHNLNGYVNCWINDIPVTYLVGCITVSRNWD